MHISKHVAFVVSLCLSRTLADFTGPTYPPPLDLSSNSSLVTASWKNLSSQLDTYLNGKSSAAAASGNVTFSIGMFSMHDPAATKHQYHHTSPGVAHGSSGEGTRSVDGDSVYRIASVTKLFTVFAGLVDMKDEDWNTPLTKIIPELANFTKTHEDGSPVYTTAWDQITPWALANQISGVARQGVAALDLLFAAVGDPNATATLMKEYGVPFANASDLGTCLDIDCTVSAYIQGVMGQPPVFEPWTTPAYANNGFILLGIAISRLTNRAMEDMYPSTIFKPLGMTSSFTSAPTDNATISRSVVVGVPADGFAAGNGLALSSGGLYSTTNDLARFGTAIVNSTLLSPLTTRKWMKPTSHTASLTYTHGAPWEIMRYVHPEGTPSAGKVTDLYTKLGDSGYYNGHMVIIPEYGAGFTILSASTNNTLRAAVTNAVLDMMAAAVIPALEGEAAQQARHNLAGTYTSGNSKLNSTMTISLSTDDIGSSGKNNGGYGGGLRITKWVSNGTDVLASDLFANLPTRLLPSLPMKEMRSQPGQSPRQVAFQATVNPQTASYTAASAAGIEGVIGPFTGSAATNSDWLTVDGAHYDNLGTNLIVFDLDPQGYATSLTPAAMKASLQREREK
ncbi:hypothetical protein LTS17_005117 [Exophiala oligosperma]